MSSSVINFEAVHPADAVIDTGMPSFQLFLDTRHDYVQAEMKEIQHQMIPLEQLEKKLAIQYGMVQDFDSVEVFGQAKRLAFANPDHDFVGNLQDLDRLNDLRLRLTELRHSHTISPPADASACSVRRYLSYLLLPLSRQIGLSHRKRCNSPSDICCTMLRYILGYRAIQDAFPTNSIL